MSNINTPPRSRVARRIRAAAAAITVGLAAGALTVTPASAADNAYIGQAPEGMTMSLYDYTVVKEGAADDAATNTCYACLTEGINSSADSGGHLLKFMYNKPDAEIASKATGRLKTIMDSQLNSYTPVVGGYKFTAGAKTDGGYPIVAIPGSTLTESTRYLFDDSTQTGKKIVDKNVAPSMFDYDTKTGVYTFNSRSMVSEYNPSLHRMETWHEPGTVTSSSMWNFFPFDHQSKMNDTENKNHYFGVKFTSPIITSADNTDGHGGHLKFYFSGDDDLWLVVDNVLVATVSGSLNRLGMTVDFTDGTISQQSGWDSNANKPIMETSTIKARFNVANATPDGGFNGNTFAPNTKHTMQVFYLERGNYASNLNLQTNLITRYPLHYDLKGGNGKGPNQVQN